MKIGVDYYPEQWDKSMWSHDAELMAQTGVKLVRIGEFAWSKLEPQDGVFDFEWLDEVISIFSRYKIEVVLCTPTNCPPLWLYQAYPETIRIGADGRPIQTGIRGHRCVNSPIFMDYAKRITHQLALRYGSNPSVVAWQIDNELEAYHCSCDVCKEKFRNWLIDRYDTLENINNTYGTTVWSNEYSDVSQIEPPTAYPQAWQNPSLCLDYYRFSSECTAMYAKELAMAIKLEIPRAKVTTNTWFCEDAPDFYKLFSELDFVSYDNYPPMRLPKDPEEFYSHAFHLDLMRGIKGDKFWIMEQLSGATGSWAPMSPAPKPGMIKGYSLQALAHGADTVVHFRWRSAAKGAEMHWQGLIDQSNVPGRRFFEFSELCKTAAKLSVIDTTELISDIAIIYSPENDRAFKIQPQSEGFYYLEQLKAFHRAFSAYGANIDVISPDADFSNYKVVVAPCMYLYKKSTAESLYRYVIKGGTLVMTNRSGVKDSSNNYVNETLPTVYRELIGAEITECDPIGNDERTITDFAGNKFTCKKWCDVLNVTTAKAYAEYDDGFYRCCPAVTMNRYCGGVAYYVGTICGSDFYKSLAANIMKQTGIPRFNGLPEGVEVTTRTNGLDDYIFFFNNSEKNAAIGLPKPMYSIIDTVGKDKIELKPFDMDIIRK